METLVSVRTLLADVLEDQLVLNRALPRTLRALLFQPGFPFALHVHAFVFVMFTVMFILPWDWPNGVLLLWIAVYVWLALRRFYGQGWLRTTLKWWTLGWLYAWLLLFGAIGLTLTTLLFT